MKTERYCFARHSETLAWHDVYECAGRFTIVANDTVKDGPKILMSCPDFVPTHVHYKGGLYRVLGFGEIVGRTEEMTLYRDGVGNFWIRPRAMFEGRMPDGRPRFAPFRIPGCA